MCETEEISLFCSGKKQDVNQSPEISPQVSVGVERNLSHRCQSHSDGRPGLSRPLSMDSTLNTESPVIPRTPSSPMSHLRGQPSYLRPLCHHYNTQYHIPSPDDCCRVTNHPQNLAASNSQFILLTVWGIANLGKAHLEISGSCGCNPMRLGLHAGEVLITWDIQDGARTWLMTEADCSLGLVNQTLACGLSSRSVSG